LLLGFTEFCVIFGKASIAVAEVWLATLLGEDEEIRQEGLDDRYFRKWQETMDIVDVGGRYDLARGDTTFVEFEVEDFIKSHELPIKKDSEAFRQLCFALPQGVRKGY
jgi:hypothetical protein